MTAVARRVDPEAELLAEMAACERDPYRWVLFSFPWGEGELEGHDGPEEWQAEILKAVRDGLLTIDEAIRIAVASGHGVGKSALVAWLILWALSTFEDTRGVVTANTETQLRTKTWPELSKWYHRCITRHWFKFTATAIFSVDPDHEKTWRIDAVPWSETNTEAFAGLHNQGKRILLVFDEASAIPNTIWEVAQGALTDAGTQIIWAVFGNPTRNTGRFKECFHRYRHRWFNKRVDARTVRFTNKTEIEEWIEDYGEDSDFVRIRVKGVFPRASATQFIAGDVVEAARKREATCTLYDPMILGVDVARFGDNRSVIRPRRGRDARTWPAKRFTKVSNVQLASYVVEYAMELGADAIFVDGGGVGGGVVDYIRHLQWDCIEVNFGGVADRGATVDGTARGERYFNKRAEMWGGMRAWLEVGAIEDSDELADDLAGPEYGFVRDNEIALEKKEHMIARGLSSPDDGDALALTFAYPVAPRDPNRIKHGSTHVHDWDPFNPET